jgi:hypothetical protein
MADIKVFPLTTNTVSKPRRESAHVSTVENPITYVVEGRVGQADPSAAASIIQIPHNFDIVDHIMWSPDNTYAVTGAASVNSKDYVESGNAIGANYTAGSTSLTLHADSPATADAYNNLYIKILTGTNAGQVRKIVDFASDVATLDSGFDAAMTSATETYRILGSSLLESTDPAGGASIYNVRVTGRYE